MTDGLAETIIRDSFNEFEDRIMERKISKQVIESLGSTDNMSSVNENTHLCHQTRIQLVGLRHQYGLQR